MPTLHLCNTPGWCVMITLFVICPLKIYTREVLCNLRLLNSLNYFIMSSSLNNQNVGVDVDPMLVSVGSAL